MKKSQTEKRKKMLEWLISIILSIFALICFITYVILSYLVIVIDKIGKQIVMLLNMIALVMIVHQCLFNSYGININFYQSSSPVEHRNLHQGTSVTVEKENMIIRKLLEELERVYDLYYNSNLRNSNLRNSNSRDSNLRSSNLRNSDLHDSNFDISDFYNLNEIPKYPNYQNTIFVVIESNSSKVNIDDIIQHFNIKYPGIILGITDYRKVENSKRMKERLNLSILEGSYIYFIDYVGSFYHPIYSLKFHKYIKSFQHLDIYKIDSIQYDFLLSYI